MSKKAASSAFAAGVLSGMLAAYYAAWAYLAWRLTHSPRRKR